MNTCHIGWSPLKHKSCLTCWWVHEIISLERAHLWQKSNFGFEYSFLKTLSKVNQNNLLTYNELQPVCLFKNNYIENAAVVERNEMVQKSQICFWVPSACSKISVKEFWSHPGQNFSRAVWWEKKLPEVLSLGLKSCRNWILTK